MISIILYYILINLPTTIKTAYKNFWNFFFESNIMINSYQVKPLYFFVFIIFAVTLCLDIYRLRKTTLSQVALIGCVILIPLCCNAINLCTPDYTHVSLHMSGGLCLFVPFTFSIVSREIRDFRKERMLLGGFSFITTFLLIWNFVLIDYADAGLMQRTKDLTVALGLRAYCAVEQDERYSSDMKLMIVGTPDCNVPAGNGLAYYDWTNGYARWGMMWGSPTTASSYVWDIILRHYVDGNVAITDESEKNEIVVQDAFKNMSIYPAQGSMEVINGIFVVKVAEG